MTDALRLTRVCTSAEASEVVKAESAVGLVPISASVVAAGGDGSALTFASAAAFVWLEPYNPLKPHRA